MFWLLLTGALSPLVAQYSLHALHEDTIFVDKLPLSFSVRYSLDNSLSGEYLFGFAADMHFEHPGLQDSSCTLRWKNLRGDRLTNYLTSGNFSAHSLQVAVTGLEPTFHLPTDTSFLEVEVCLQEADTSVHELYLYATSAQGNDFLGNPLEVEGFRDTVFFVFPSGPVAPGTIIVDPGNGKVRVRFDRDMPWEEVDFIRLLSTSGRSLMVVQVNGPEIVFSTEDLWPGLYLVEFRFTTGGKAIRKLFIRR